MNIKGRVTKNKRKDTSDPEKYFQNWWRSLTQIYSPLSILGCISDIDGQYTTVYDAILKRQINVSTMEWYEAG